jgi:hypothetical protein
LPLERFFPPLCQSRLSNTSTDPAAASTCSSVWRGLVNGACLLLGLLPARWVPGQMCVPPFSCAHDSDRQECYNPGPRIYFP